MAALERTWTQVAELLENAAAALPEQAEDSRVSRRGPLSGTLGEFHEFLEHNELELAWDALAEVAKKTKAGAAVWFMLARAATLMGLTGQSKLATRKLITAMKREEPRYRLVYLRRYRNRQGKLVWQKPTHSPERKGLTPA